MSRKRSGGGVLFGLIVIVAAIALLFFVHHALPGLFKLLLGIGLFIIALFVALIVVIIVAARKGTKKMAEKSQQAAAKTVNKSGLTPEQALYGPDLLSARHPILWRARRRHMHSVWK